MECSPLDARLLIAAERGDWLTAHKLLRRASTRASARGHVAPLSPPEQILSEIRGDLEEKASIESGDSLHCSRGVNVNVRDRQPLGESALSKAAKGGHTEICRVLLDAGASPNLHDALRVTALHQAARGSHVTVIKLLLAHGADPTFKSTNGMLAINYAPYGSESWRVLKDASAGITLTVPETVDIVPIVPAFSIPRGSTASVERKSEKNKMKKLTNKSGKKMKKL